MLSIRLMQSADLPAVIKLQDRCYATELFEPADVVVSRFKNCAETCWVALYQDKLWGYLFTYPSLAGKIGALAEEFRPVAAADCLYLHDMAVSSDARGQGVARALLEQAQHYASTQQFRTLALVAVQNSSSYWQQQGFEPLTETTPEQQLLLASYIGQQAQYLQKIL
ncbi:GNAT family N-acetyltransferase [Rheinheimera sp. SA_1]|uniref:GNAT family N-acetyltransferase n=1 Tax=Rheinheimera sp. SA_1 TaxID=1827365 RepID=UPI0009ECF4EC|nr:GNAT family N-acetyltransferase [Rheinheimera sp. SA_1]